LGGADGRTMVTADKITIANRVAKIPEIMVTDSISAPAVVGAFALNQFNIILDYATGSLLLR
jgi:hypothetical protein